MINILIISSFCLGWHLITRSEMLLEKVGVWLDRLPKWIGKPLGACVPCCASIIGSIGYLLVYSGNYNIKTWVLTIMACAFVNSALWFWYQKNLQTTLDKRFIIKMRKAQYNAMQPKPKDCNNCGKQNNNNGKDNKDTKLEEQQ